MTKYLLLVILTICLSSCSTKPPAQLPIPPGMKAVRMARSAAMPQVRSLATPQAEASPGFSITNLSLSNGTVTLLWSGGNPPFQVEAEPSLSGPWSMVGNSTLRHSATLDSDQNHFWRIRQSVPLLSVTATNPTTLEWLSPTLDMSDALSSFIIQRRTDIPTVGNGLASDDDTGWSDCPISGITGCPVAPDPTKGTTGAPYTITDSTTPNPKLFWRPKQVTANGVRVPYNFAPAGSAAPGTVILAKRFDSSIGEAYICSHPSGGTIVVVSFAGTMDFGNGTGPLVANFLDLGVAKFDSSGNAVWSKRFGGTGGTGTIRPRVVACDADGAFYVGGFFKQTVNFGGVNRTAVTSQDAWIAKYDTDGNWVWDSNYHGTGNGSIVGDSLSAIVTTATAVFAAGYWQGEQMDFGDGVTHFSTGGLNPFLIKLSKVDGTTALSHSFGASGDSGSTFGLAKDSADNVFITGQARGKINLNSDSPLPFPYPAGTMDAGCFVGKFNSSGTLLWQTSLASSGAVPAIGYAVATDSSGNVFVAGGFGANMTTAAGTITATAQESPFVAKLSGANGVCSWFRVLTGGTILRFFGVAVDSSGNPVLVGEYDNSINFGSGTLASAGVNAPTGFIVKYNGAASGANPSNLMWFEIMTGRGGRQPASTGIETPFGVVVDPSNNNWMTGYTTGTCYFGGTTMVATGFNLFLAEIQ